MLPKLSPKRALHLNPNRTFATSRRVQDRSKLKRNHALETVVEKWKTFSKTHFLLDHLFAEPEHVTPIRNLEQFRRQLNLPRPHRMSDFLRKSSKLFDLCKDSRGTLWAGLTPLALQLISEHDDLIRSHSEKSSIYITKMLMMSVNKKLPLSKISHFRRDFGLPYDFQKKWVHCYPDLFRVVKDRDEDDEYLDLVQWRDDLAVTELERKSSGGSEEVEKGLPGVLRLGFPMKFPEGYKKVYRYGGKIENFQKREYLSPYADGGGGREELMVAGTKEFDKRAVAVMHELLSFTLEKRLVTDHLTHFRWEFRMPQKLMRLLLKHFGIFYVSERGKRFHVFLNEAYVGDELVEKGPLNLWREKVQGLVGSRGRKKRVGVLDVGDEDEGEESLFEIDEEDEKLRDEVEKEGMSEELDGGLSEFEDEEEEMDVGDVGIAYKEENA